MADPFTLSALGMVAATEGVKFLYAQATEVVKKIREKRDADKKLAEGAAPAGTALIVASATAVPALFEKKGEIPDIHLDEAEKVETELNAARKALADYHDDTETLKENDTEVFAQIDSLRRLLERVYQRELTFIGETRTSTGLNIVSNIVVKDVEGELTGVEATKQMDANINASMKIETIKKDGKVTGVKL